MYITGKYWGNLIGDTDDSLTLMDYLSEKGKSEVDVREIFSDFGLDRLEGDFRAPEVPIVYTGEEGWETDIHFAVDLVTDLAALLLECKVSGSVDLGELGGGEASGPLRITAGPEEHALVDRTLRDFAAQPLRYDPYLSELVPEEDMRALAALCAELREELYG